MSLGSHPASLPHFHHLPGMAPGTHPQVCILLMVKPEAWLKRCRNGNSESPPHPSTFEQLQVSVGQKQLGQQKRRWWWPSLRLHRGMCPLPTPQNHCIFQIKDSRQAGAYFPLSVWDVFSPSSHYRFEISSNPGSWRRGCLLWQPQGAQTPSFLCSLSIHPALAFGLGAACQH